MSSGWSVPISTGARRAAAPSRSGRRRSSGWPTLASGSPTSATVWPVAWSACWRCASSLSPARSATSRVASSRSRRRWVSLLGRANGGYASLPCLPGLRQPGHPEHWPRAAARRLAPRASLPGTSPAVWRRSAGLSAFARLRRDVHPGPYPHSGRDGLGRQLPTRPSAGCQRTDLAGSAGSTARGRHGRQAPPAPAV